jgi:large subunit ribosomal protein L17
MVTSLIKYEKIETTQAKAKEIRRTAEKLVTRAKVDSVHNRRIVAKTVYEKDVVNKLFTEVGPRFSDRPGGYTRILKLGKRSGDAAEMVILEFLAEEEKAVPKKKPAKKKAASKPAAPKKAAEEKVEAPPEEAKAEESTAVDEAAPADTDVAVDEKAEREASEE